MQIILKLPKVDPIDFGCVNFTKKCVNFTKKCVNYTKIRLKTRVKKVEK